MKKFLVAIIFLGSISLLSASNSDKHDNQVISLGDGYVSLQNGTTAAFSIYLTSVNATGTTTGRYTAYASSITLEQLNSGGGSATNYFNVLLSTSDSIFDIINRINEITNWTATISQGCYGLQYATGSASVRVDGEGTTDGLQYDIGGKATTISTGSVNAITVYLNGTLYTTIKKDPVKYQEFAVQSMNADLLQGTTMSIYIGNVSSDTTILLDLPRTQLKVFEYPTGLPLPITNQKYWEYRVVYGTWTNCSGDNINRVGVGYYKFKK
jgi:hypothetical protein